MKVIAILLVLAAVAGAATEVLQVAAVGYYDQWFGEPWGIKVTSVQLPDDENSTKIYIGTAGLRQSYTLAASAIPAGSTINNVSISMRVQAWDAPEVQLFLRLGGTDLDGSLQACSTLFTTYVDAIPRPGGGPWDLADLSTLEIGILLVTATNWPNLTTLFAVVDYTEGGGEPATGNWWLMF